jgi:hypothetical protein
MISARPASPRGDWFAAHAPKLGVALPSGIPPPPAGFDLDKPPAQAAAIDFTGGQFADEKPYWTPRIALAVLPPIMGYLVLFIAVPWIVKGFSVEPKPN